MKQKALGELLGTFGIVFAPVALSASGKLPGGDSSLAAAAWVSGLAVLAMIYTLGHVSGAHFNPAVTLGFAASGRFPWKQVPVYVLSQLAGAILAAALAAAIFGKGAWGVHVPHASLLSCFLLEALLSFFLMLVIISVATDARAAGGFAGTAIGLGVVFLVWIGGPVTGGSMNPARSLGPALLSGGPALANCWLYILAPCLGTVLAARLYDALRE
ncbi:MAG: aquaporin [Armatimonas sp.]